MSPKSFAYDSMLTLLEDFLNTPISLSADVESIFSLGINKDVLCPKRLSNAHFQFLCFLKEMNNLLVSNLAACVICFEYCFCTVA